MDYEKKYKEALANARQEYNTTENVERKQWLENLFPELKKSDGETIRGAIIHFISHTPTVPKGIIGKETMIAWLEKQVQKPVFEMKTPEESLGIDSDTYNKIVDECIYGEQNLADKNEPKFHEGDWITNGDYTWKIVEVKPLDYILQSQDGNIVDDTISHVDEQFHSFAIEDAKDGDVLACESGWTCIFKTLVNDETFSSYCFMDKTKSFFETGSECHTLNEEFTKAYNGEIKPATKEQRDTLLKAIADAGYTFDFEKKELEKIEQKPTDEEMKEVLRTEYEKGRAEVIAEMQNHAWSEEDMSKIQRICKYLNEAKKYYADTTEVRDCMDWLKSLEDRVQPQPKQEWSEEDESILQGIWDEILANKHNAKECEWKTYDKFLDWLKSLKNRVQPKHILHKHTIFDQII